MARIAGVDLPKNKRIETALTYVYGIGLKTSKMLLEKSGVSNDIKTDDLSEIDVRKIREAIESSCKVEGDLRREVSEAIHRLKDLNVYRGLRHRRGLPVRGQRTSTNARTCKGPRRVAVKRKGAAVNKK